MNEQSRIEALFEEGRLTREQADALLAALEESSARPLVLADPVPAHTGTQRAASTGYSPAVQAEPRSPEEPANLRWLDVNVMAGEVRIKVDDSIEFPVATEGEVERTGDGARLSQLPRNHQGNLLEKIIDTARVSTVRVALPPGWAVRLDVKGGESHIDGAVAYVSGRVGAGSVTIAETSGINLDVTAGEVRAGLRLVGGNHRISTTAGSARVRLLHGSNTEVHARSSVGSIKIRQLEVRESGLSAEAHGTLAVGTSGEPQSTLSISVVTGEIRVETADE